MSEHEDNLPEEISRSQRKRDVHDLQKIGETLVGLSDSVLAKIPIPETLLDSIHHAKTLTSHGALRRQLQYIGKLMRKIDAEPIKIALRKIQSCNENNTAHFHQIEQWREELISKGDEALQKFLESNPQANKQTLRQLIRKAQDDRAHNKKTGGETALFKYLREILKEV